MFFCRNVTCMYGLYVWIYAKNLRQFICMILEELFIGEVNTSWSSLNMDLKLFSMWDHSLDQESGVWELWCVFITRGWIIHLLSGVFSYGQRLDMMYYI